MLFPYMSPQLVSTPSVPQIKYHPSCLRLFLPCFGFFITFLPQPVVYQVVYLFIVSSLDHEHKAEAF